MVAILGGSVLTLMDWARRKDPNGSISTIVELLSQNNDILQDMTMLEGNLPTGHKTTIRTGLPTGTWRLLNYGVSLGKSTTAQIVDTVGNLEAESQVDRDLAALNGNTAEFRLSEAKAYLEGLGQQMAQTIVYGNSGVNPERFTGLAPRFNSTAGSSSSANVLDAGGTGSDNTSIWIVTWGSDTVHGIFPKGSQVGLQHEDKGEWRVNDAASNPYWALVDHYKWQMGLTVRDWRYVIRICNIDVSDLATTSAANIINLLVRAVHRLPTVNPMIANVQTSDAPSIQGSMGRTVIYANRTVATYLDLQAMNKTNVLLTQGQFGGMPIVNFRGIPIRTCDVILNTESRIV